ncbi:MAG: IS110 family transposase [Actinomycetota bacterium]|nr:IS110 family transposase [Actinomycetota bacterium]
MFTDDATFVIGVDTHRDSHAYAVVECATGAVCDQFEYPADAAGYRDALCRAERLGGGGLVWAVEGTGSYGAGLTFLLQSVGGRVVEVDHPHRRDPDARGKSDALDAIRAARMILGRDRHTQPREGAGPRQALRVLQIARRGAIRTRTDAIRQLRSLIISLPDQTRGKLRALTSDRLVIECAKLRLPRQDQHQAAAIRAVRAIARRALAATDEANQHERDIATWVRALNPQLLDEVGVGPISAAQLLVSWSHSGRLESEACFARLAGVAPIPASSGNTTRHRLDRGGDRQLNNAIHTIALARAKRDPETITYIARRVSEGKTRREAIRALKRHITRRIYHTLETTSRPLDNP